MRALPFGRPHMRFRVTALRRLRSGETQEEFGVVLALNARNAINRAKQQHSARVKRLGRMRWSAVVVS
jgi:hypothetical protein